MNGRQRHIKTERDINSQNSNDKDYIIVYPIHIEKLQNTLNNFMSISRLIK